MLRGKDVANMNAQQVKEMVGQKKVAPNTRRFICNALKSLFLFCKRADLWSSLEVRRGNPEEKMFPLVSPSQSRRYRVLRRALDELGLEGGLHTFRHSVSMLLFKRCGDIKSVCQVLGHSPQVGLKYYQHTRSVEEVREKVFGE